MKKSSLLKTLFLLCALITGSASSWADVTTIYSWNGNGSTTTANETGGTATAKGGNSNIVVGVSQKGNYCLKMNKGFSNTNYIEIELEQALEGGEKIAIGAFRTSTTAAVLGVDFGTTETQQLNSTTSVLSSNGTPTDWVITVPDEAAGKTKIRLYRNSGSTGMWVSKFVITTESSITLTTPTFSCAPSTVSVNIGEVASTVITTDYDGTISVESDDNAIATATYNASTKTISVTGVAAGTTTINVTGPATTTYKALNRTIDVQVTIPELAYKFNDVMSGFGYSYFGLTPSESDTFAQPATTTTKTDAYGVTIALAKADAENDPRYDSNYIRFYKKNTLTITAPAGTYITKVVFVEPSTNAQWNGTMTASTGNYVNGEKSWYAESTDVNELVLTGASGTNRFGGMEIHLNGSIAATVNASYEWATFCSTLPLDFTGTGVDAYIVTGVSGSSIVKTKVTKVPANTGLLINGASANIPLAAADETEDVSANKMVAGNGETISAVTGKTRYVLADDSGKAMFLYIGATPATVPAGKAYLEIDGAAARALSLDEETTGIGATFNDNVEMINDNVIYDLSGRRVENPTKGIFIINGKKVVIR